MEMSSSTRTTIVAVFAIYTILLLGYSLYSRRAMKEGKGDYISKLDQVRLPCKDSGSSEP